MMSDLIRCEVNRLPSGAVTLNPSECFDYMLANWRRPSRSLDANQRWVPPADIAETDEHYRITLEAPGIDMKSLDVTFENGVLKVKGDKYTESEFGECCHCSERFSGSFERSFKISGTIDVDHIDAVYRDGILNVTLPKSESRKARRIEVH